LGATITGWWYTYPSEKYEFVSWDDDIPNIWGNKTTNQIHTQMFCAKEVHGLRHSIHSKEMNLKKRRISHSLEHNRTVGKACLQ